MAITNHERVGKALDLLKDGLAPFVERELKSAVSGKAGSTKSSAALSSARTRLAGTKPIAEWDVAALLTVMWNQWNDVFRKTLGQAERTPRQRTARCPQQVGAPGAIFERRCLSRARLRRATADRRLGAAGRRSSRR